ncbi:MAG TPA: transaldolase [Gaiellaceae bacterium]|nr:transaldolase [Gaiellaceae bacterium]
MSKSRLHELSEHGQSVWVDSVSREWLETGELARMIDEDAVVGVTSNPTIFQKALSEGDWYDEQLREVLGEENDDKEVFYRLAVSDIQDACDVLRRVWDEGKGQDGYVSMEVDPDLAYERDATIDEAMRLHEWIDRPNLFVKIPATEPGLGAIEECIARGRSINVTLIFSLERHEAVAEAYIRGLERLVESGGDPSTVASVASFFVSRVDTEADKRLEAIGTDEALALRGKLAIANAKLAYENYKRIFSGERWERLAAAGATRQRCLWASTSTKNPEYRDVMYVEELLGPETVNTMPKETVEAFQDHGVVADTLERDVDAARRLLDELAAVGIDYDDVVDTLEREGVQKFSDSFRELLDGIRTKRAQLVAA